MCPKERGVLVLFYGTDLLNLSCRSSCLGSTLMSRRRGACRGGACYRLLLVIVFFFIVGVLVRLGAEIAIAVSWRILLPADELEFGVAATPPRADHAWVYRKARVGNTFARTSEADAVVGVSLWHLPAAPLGPLLLRGDVVELTIEGTHLDRL